MRKDDAELKVRFDLAEGENVSLVVLSEAGRQLYRLPKRYFEDGQHEILIPQSVLRSGDTQRSDQVLYIHVTKAETVEKIKVISE